MSADATLPDAPPVAAALPDDPATLKGMIRELLEQLRNEQHAAKRSSSGWTNSSAGSTARSVPGQIVIAFVAELSL